MIFTFLLILLAGYFGMVGWTVRAYEPAQRTAKLTIPLSKLINLAPLPGIAVFTVLFLFVLKGQLIPRISHAVLVFGLWIYAAQFYQYAFSYFYQKKILVVSLAGMAGSAALAVILTPLDRYVRFVYSFLNLGSLFFSCGFLLLLYAVKFFRYWKSKTKEKGDMDGH